MVHRLAEVLDGAAHSRFPDPDGSVEVVGAPPGGTSAIVCFTAHTFLAADVDAGEVASRVPTGDLSIPMSPEFVYWLASRTGTKPGTQDAVFVSLATGGEPPDDLEQV